MRYDIQLNKHTEWGKDQMQTRLLLREEPHGGLGQSIALPVLGYEHASACPAKRSDLILITSQPISKHFFLNQ